MTQETKAFRTLRNELQAGIGDLEKFASYMHLCHLVELDENGGEYPRDWDTSNPIQLRLTTEEERH